MPLVKPHIDIPSRLLALLVFLLGIGILLFVFITALHLFTAPVPGLELPVSPGAPAPPAVNIGTALALFVRKLLLLCLMTVAGSLLEGKGIHLYYGTHTAAVTQSQPEKNQQPPADDPKPE